MDPRDLYMLFICTFRYMIGRPFKVTDYSEMASSYEVLIEKYGRLLEMSHRQQIIAEIGEHVHAASILGSETVFGAVGVQQTWERIAGYLAKLGDASDPSMPTLDEVKLIKQHRIIDAIKSLRMRTNLGLKEAKEMTDLWRNNPAKYGL